MSSEIVVTFRGKTHSVDLPLSAAVSELGTQLEQLTGVPRSNQKLIWKGRKANTLPDTTLEDAGLRSGIKIVLLGSTITELNDLKVIESEVHRRDAIMARRAASGPSKVRSTGKASSSALKYRFHRIEPLQHLPKPEEATKLLTKLANDPAILHVMETHEFTVGLLTELAPHEHPNLLGLNENAGQAIKLRIRTDSYDGFRLYSEIRRVSIHELTHNRHGDHDDKFKTLNSQLNKEVAQFEAAAREGSHSLGGGGGLSYEPSGTDEGQETRHILGGGSSQVLGGSNSPASLEERRARIVEAAMRRFREEETEIEDRCAT